jgi:hypothetical protein
MANSLCLRFCAYAKDLVGSPGGSRLLELFASIPVEMFVLNFTSYLLRKQIDFMRMQSGGSTDSHKVTRELTIWKLQRSIK